MPDDEEEALSMGDQTRLDVNRQSGRLRCAHVRMAEGDRYFPVQFAAPATMRAFHELLGMMVLRTGPNPSLDPVGCRGTYVEFAEVPLFLRQSNCASWSDPDDLGCGEQLMLEAVKPQGMIFGVDEDISVAWADLNDGDPNGRNDGCWRRVFVPWANIRSVYGDMDS